MVEVTDLHMHFGAVRALGGVSFNMLANNAVDSMPNGGDLFVGSEYDDKEIRVIIRDNGCGIDDASIKQVFDPFFTTKPPGNGTGLGLAVCYGIVTSHGGTIEINSKLSSGTEFIIHLPRN